MLKKTPTKNKQYVDKLRIDRNSEKQPACIGQF